MDPNQPNPNPAPEENLNPVNSRIKGTGVVEGENKEIISNKKDLKSLISIFFSFLGGFFGGFLFLMILMMILSFVAGIKCLLGSSLICSNLSIFLFILFILLLAISYILSKFVRNFYFFIGSAVYFFLACAIAFYLFLHLPDTVNSYVNKISMDFRTYTDVLINFLLDPRYFKQF